MAIPLLKEPIEADDRYAEYFAEKLWAWIPEVYRNEDFRARKPGVLRALVEILAADAATARRSIDRLWEDTLIDYADDWAVPYIGDLVATRLLNGLNRRGMRIDVARTVFYRRRAGTPVVLETLIKDITGWGGVVQEGFRRLARTWHGLDADPYAVPDGFFGTPKGGTANLRLADIDERVDGAFDSYAHLADFRRATPKLGRYNIPKLNVHLYRQKPVRLSRTTALQIRPRCWTVDPSGRDVALFANNGRAEATTWSPAREAQMPAPIGCRQLNSIVFALGKSDIPPAFGTSLDTLAGGRIFGARKLLELVTAILNAAPPAQDFLDLQAATGEAQSPKLEHLAQSLRLRAGADLAAAQALEPEQISAAFLATWDDPPAGSPLTLGVDMVVDPTRGRILMRGPARPIPEAWHYGQFGLRGAGGYDRVSRILPGATPLADGGTSPGPVGLGPLPQNGLHGFTTSKTYERSGNALADVDELNLQADNFERPYLRLLLPPADDEFVVTALAQDLNAEADDPINRRSLTLEGVWLGLDHAARLTEPLLDPTAAATPVERRLVIDGLFQRVEISNSTLDPGGERARAAPGTALPIPAVTLVLRGQIDELVIDNSILGAILEERTNADPCSVGKVIIRDSIVLGFPGAPAITMPTGALEIERSTVFGAIECNRIDATEALVTGTVTVTDNQHGCFRFSAAAADGPYRLPAQFESHLFADGLPPSTFVSRRFGDAGFAQLGPEAPREILRGGENTSEIGAFNALLTPVLADDLARKFEEYAPLNLVSQFIFET